MGKTRNFMKTLVILTGGTFSSINLGKGLSTAETDIAILKTKIEEELPYHIDIEMVQPFSKLSENIDDIDWVNLINCLDNCVSPDIDSIIVVHGTDTMAYTSSVLAYFEKFSKKLPIITTGANYSIHEKGTDAIVNLVQSIIVSTKFAAKNIYGSFIVFNGSNDFGNKALIHIGTKVKKDIWEDTCYRSFYLGSRQIGYLENKDNLVFDNELYTSLFPKDIKYDIKTKFNVSDLSTYKIYPGFDPNIIKRDVNDGKKYFLLEIYNSGTGPAKDTYLSLTNNIKYAVSKGCLVFAISQHEGHLGATMNLYESSTLFVDAGVIPLKNMIWEASIPKLMLASATFNKNDEIVKYMLTNISCEINSN